MTSSNPNYEWYRIIESFTDAFEKPYNIKINTEEYLLAENSYLFSILVTTEPFGMFFCKRYKFFDYLLMYPINKSFDEQKEYILKNYVTCK